MAREEIVSIRNPNGNVLFGILHIPDDEECQMGRIGINLLNPGLKNRVAPNRLYIKIARTLAGQGYYVLRMDPAGIGDSEGEIPEELVVDIWSDIQKGRFVKDVICMNDYFIKTWCIQNLVLMGSCGGAITALLAGDNDRRVRELVLIDVPVTLASSKTANEDYLAIIEADENYRSWLTSYYFRSLFNPRKWLRVLMMKSNFHAFAKVIILKVRELFMLEKDKHEKSEQVDVHNMNPYFLRSIKQVLSRDVNVLFLCAEKDTDTQLFYKGFRNVYLGPGNKYEGFYTVVEVKDANHIYTLKASQDDLIMKISEWMASFRYCKPLNQLKCPGR